MESIDNCRIYDTAKSTLIFTGSNVRPPDLSNWNKTEIYTTQNGEWYVVYQDLITTTYTALSREEAFRILDKISSVEGLENYFKDQLTES